MDKKTFAVAEEVSYEALKNAKVYKDGKLVAEAEHMDLLLERNLEGKIDWVGLNAINPVEGHYELVIAIVLQVGWETKFITSVDYLAGILAEAGATSTQELVGKEVLAKLYGEECQSFTFLKEDQE